ncbi:MULTISPECIES: PIN domain-containing protein [unclassified Siphonobacter]|uniref:PIN domain-containing protein n=1 Tax=unclassified Siphonobacter TaxID=2635712 RepID=UPI000CC3D64D|nr:MULTISPECIES: PIN domain-containing protein [unclassified Siphonobacter]MDQ1088488.1 rRNA-processing protein FCF1 [Siphonobacter sp. SORGH_AS_1065]MDR6194635.1 rRNA-processing protein FCF1 [Siphonobacter sp. SORGH_AS_0500]PKK35472.1 hypothetical protein BWI96_16315 [Siphonobacter sp. SORGH_AS_0500]
MILIDTNALVLLIVGLIDNNLIGKHKRTSIYDEEDFQLLLQVIGDLNQLVVLPNIWTEVDNLLNNFGGTYKYPYLERITEIISVTSEKYLDSVSGTKTHSFYELGLTDSLILEYAKECKFLITSDSKLSDYATASGIKVYDMVKQKNTRIENY